MDCRPNPQVAMDAHGMRPDDLDRQLAWAAAQLAAAAGSDTGAASQTEAGATPRPPAAVQPAAAHPEAQGGAGQCVSTAGGAAGDVVGGGLAEPYVPPSHRMPRAVYLIPTGHNPTGVTMPPERKRAIYEVRVRLCMFLGVFWSPCLSVYRSSSHRAFRSSLEFEWGSFYQLQFPGFAVQRMLQQGAAVL